ncbi:hypothetical protein [Aquimarina mytili]|uniref:Uncharacterized protein n=1 Tax=Aquimarina mytili TaxID=874423 RepID=A0A937DAM6_9FLAO|nr:hypothetical protein [Aquimarina mytili]MBL0684897.1 hypothetical protein [Aquimarina mytili]
MKHKEYKVKIGRKKYQLIFKDNEVQIKGRFYWDNKKVLKGDFKLRNYDNTGKNKFKLHRVLFCHERTQLEAFLSNHSSFERKTYKCHDEPTGKMSFEEIDQIGFLIRVAENSTSNNYKLCDDTKPGDKDGSILIGTELI